MVQQLRAFLAPPSFQDEQKTRHAELLNLILLYSAALCGVALFLRPFEIGTLWLLAFIASSLYLRTLLKKGLVDLVGWVHISLLWLILSYFTLQSGRVDSSATAGYTLVVLVAALALGRSAALIYLILSIVASGLVAYLQYTAGLQPPPVRPGVAWVGDIILLVNIWLVIAYALKQISDSISEARQEARDRKLMGERLLQQTRYLAALHQTTFSLINQLDLSSLLDMILKEAAELLDSHDGYLDLISADGESAVREVGIGIYHPMTGLIVGKSQGLTGQVWSGSQTVIVEDYGSWPHRHEIMPEPSPNAVVGTPLRIGDEIIGVLGLAYTEKGRTFSLQQAESLSELAELASLAYHNASLHEQVQAELAERRNAEQTLATSENRLHLVMEAGELGTWDWDLTTDRLQYDEQWERMLDYAPGQTESDISWWMDNIHPDDRLGAMRALKNHIEGLAPAFDLELRMRDAAGTWRWLLLRGKVTKRDAQGRPLVVSGTQIDISNRVAMEVALREANSMLDSYSRELEHRARLLTAASEISRTATGILDQDSLGQLAVDHVAAEFELYYVGLFLVDEANKTAVLHAGTGAPGKHMLAQRHTLEIGGTSMIGWCIAHSEARVALDVGREAVRFDNPLLPLTRSEAALPLISRGVVLGALSIQSVRESAFSGEDIAVFRTMADQLANAIANAQLYDQLQRELVQRRRVEVEIRMLNTELEKRVQQRTAALQDANKEMESFSYSVSHDLRAPLRSISSYSRLLSRDFERVIDSVNYMSELIDDLLRLSRVTRQDISLSTVNLTALAQVSLEELQQHSPDYAPQIEVQENLTAQGDERLLRLALGNLLSNAWKFTSKTPDAWIKFGAEHRNGEWVFFVRDNGVGFDMQYASKLFGTFQRLHSQEEFPGMGIGLAIVQRVIHRHGGRIWAEGKRNKGATFYFTLG
jgi:signal transduction histidine kinase/PAS domain-containing protein